MSKRPRGRPRKQPDSTTLLQLGRAALVLSAYDKAREQGEKHSVAITYAVDCVRRVNRTVSISETEVKRILAKFRSKGSESILRFDPAPLSDERDIAKHIMFRNVEYELKGKTLPTPMHRDETRPHARFLLSFASKPAYPRHNSKNPSLS